MKKGFYLAIPILIPAILVAILAIYERSRAPAWRIELEKYIRYQEGLSQAQISFVEADRASKPWLFTKDKSFTTLSDSYYTTDINYADAEAVGEGYPLPYPPEEVWCILLAVIPDQAIDPKGFHQAVFITRHVDLYGSGWVVHETEEDPFTAQFRARLTKYGCELVLRATPEMIGCLTKALIR